MSEIVLDCSVAVSWLFEDEADETMDNILDMVVTQGAWVPSLWHLEVTNVLIQASKRERIAYASIPKRLDVLNTLPIRTDLETHERAFTDIVYLAEENKLTSYDAAYIELAFRKNLMLATKDKDLQKAAKGLQIPILK